MARLKVHKRPIEIQYFLGVREVRRPIAKGFSASLQNAIGTAARNLATEHRPKAVIIDRDALKIMVILTRTAAGVSIIRKD